MSTLTLPEIPLLPVSLIDDTKGEGEKNFDDLMFMGAPQVIPMKDSPAWMDEDLKHFVVERKAVETFYLVCIACDFRPRVDARVTRAWVKISLNRSDGLEPQPLAWWMHPGKESDPVKSNRGAEVSANAQFVGLKVNASEDRTRDEVYLSAHGAGGSSPYWDLQEREGRKLETQVLLKLVVSVAIGVEGNGMVVVDTAVTEGKFIRSRHANLGAKMASVVLK